MARVVLSQPIAEIHGAFTKGGDIINRQKKYRDELGKVHLLQHYQRMLLPVQLLQKPIQQ